MALRYVVRTFVQRDDGKFLLIQHKNDDTRVLPGGHVEPGETLTRALKREVKEEFGLQIKVLGTKARIGAEHIMTHPLPISVHEVSYASTKNDKHVSKLEFRYFSVLVDGDIVMDTAEIKAYDWFEYDAIMKMEVNADVYPGMQEILEQNFDLLELL